jgi:hypothetical protein
VNFLRRGSTAPDDEDASSAAPGSDAAGSELADDDIAEDDAADDDVADDETAGAGAEAAVSGKTATPATSGAAATSAQSERQQKESKRASRMDLIRQARRASSAMQDPEPVRGLMVAGFLVLVGLVSYFSTDSEQVSQKVHGKTQVVSQSITHPATAILLVVVALVAAGTIYWRKRYVTGIAFMVAAAVGIGAPLPKTLSDGMWLTFLVPAGYVLWMLMFRMNKEQKAWLAAHGAANQSAGGTSSSSSSRQKSSSSRGQTAASSSRSRKKDQVAISTSGRPLPENSGRYTRPQSKPKAGQRRP